MGPRSIDRGIGDPLRRGDHAADALQWGRDLSIAEFGFEIGEFVRDGLLQWGRDLSIAEFLPSGRVSYPLFRFNGAAIYRSRNYRRGTVNTGAAQ